MIPSLHVFGNALLTASSLLVSVLLSFSSRRLSFRYTTKPYLNEVRFIGSVPTPWPSWAIAASTSFLSNSPDAKSTLRTFLTSLEAKVVEFDSPEKREKDDVDFVMKEFGYPEEDVKAWLGTVGYFSKLEGMDEEMVRKTLA